MGVLVGQSQLVWMACLVLLVFGFVGCQLVGFVARLVAWWVHALVERDSPWLRGTHLGVGRERVGWLIDGWCCRLCGIQLFFGLIELVGSGFLGLALSSVGRLAKPGFLTPQQPTPEDISSGL